MSISYKKEAVEIEKAAKKMASDARIAEKMSRILGETDGVATAASEAVPEPEPEPEPIVQEKPAAKKKAAPKKKAKAKKS